VCVCAFLPHRESPDMILGDKPLISEVVLSHKVLGFHLYYEMTATSKQPLISESIAAIRFGVHPVGKEPYQHIICVAP
jgi:hypothetical protein